MIQSMQIVRKSLRSLRILLIWPKARTDPDWGGDLGAIAEPLALEYLAAAAIADGHEVRIFDQRLHQDDDVSEIIGRFVPDVVGITAFSMHVLAAVAIARIAKQIHPDTKLVAGGHHATFLPEDFFEDCFDFVVSGEGVEPFVALLRELSRDTETFAEIPGLWSRRDHYFVLGQGRRLLNIDTLPRPARHLTAEDRSRYFIDWMAPVACIRSTMGCPYRCSFCSLWQMTEGRYYRREISPFVEELQEIPEEYVFLIDDEAFVNRERMIGAAEAIGLSGVRKRFFAYARVDTILRQESALIAWKSIGLERLLVGIDAISSRDLTEYNKGYAVSAIERALEVADRIGIEIFAQFVVNTNYTERDFNRLVRFVEHYKIRYPSFTVLTPLPGTPALNSFAKVIERQANGRPNWDLFDTQNAVTRTTLPAAEFRLAYRDLYRRFGASYSTHRLRGQRAGVGNAF